MLRAAELRDAAKAAAGAAQRVMGWCSGNTTAGYVACRPNTHIRCRRKFPIVQGGDESKSWIHITDAVSAITAALERGRGGEVYNIVDDEPVNFSDFILAAAQVFGAPHPRTLPLWFLRLTAPYAAASLSTRLNVSNEKAKRELGWHLRFPNYQEGLKDLATGAERESKVA